ncbi:MAG: hypothetical protein LBH73_00035, partial [Spirochaetaceae bacterium]|nr:hypothetical protein [Spirochaetaceae bacterium]
MNVSKTNMRMYSTDYGFGACDSAGGYRYERIEYTPYGETWIEERNGNLPGMGGVYNYVNLHVYHYAGNNPI